MNNSKKLSWFGSRFLFGMIPNLCCMFFWWELKKQPKTSKHLKQHKIQTLIQRGYSASNDPHPPKKQKCKNHWFYCIFLFFRSFLLKNHRFYCDVWLKTCIFSEKPCARMQKTVEIWNTKCIFSENPCAKMQKTQKNKKTIMFCVKKCKIEAFLVRILVWKRIFAPGNSGHWVFLGFSILRYVGVFCHSCYMIGVYVLSFSFILVESIVVYLKLGSRLTFLLTFWFTFILTFIFTFLLTFLLTFWLTCSFTFLSVSYTHLTLPTTPYV